MSYIGKIAGMFFAPILFGVFFTTAPAHATSFVQTTYATKASNAALPTSVTATFLAPATAGDMLIAVVGADGSATINMPVGGWSVAINQRAFQARRFFIALRTEVRQV